MQFPRNLKVSMLLGSTLNKNGFRENETIYAGLDFQFLSLLSEKLNFRYTIHIEESYGQMTDNGSWIGITGALGRGEADISPTYCPLLAGRAQVIDYSVPYYTVETTFATAIPKPLPRHYVLLLPFHVQVWIALLVSILLVPNMLQQALFRKQSWKDYFINLIGCNDMPQSVEKSLSFRIFNGSWLLLETIMTFTYISVILSFLTVTVRSKGVRNIHELANAIERGEMRFTVLSGTLEAHSMVESDSKDIRKIGEAVIRNNWFEHIDYGKEVEDNNAIFGSRAMLIVWRGKPPFTTLALGEDSFGVWSAGVMVKKNFCCLERLNTIILRINSAGLYQKIVDDITFERQFYLNTNRQSEDQVKELGLDSLSGIFFFLVIFHIASLIVFAAECFYYRWQKNKMA